VRLRDQDDGDDMTMESILAHFDEYGDIMEGARVFYSYSLLRPFQT
jgi:hypothetical protein